MGTVMILYTVVIGVAVAEGAAIKKLYKDKKELEEELKERK